MLYKYGYRKELIAITVSFPYCDQTIYVYKYDKNLLSILLMVD